MTSAALPLAGVRVLDLSRVLAGPYCTMTLADMGADVIKIENPDGGDDSRTFSPFHGGHSVYFLTFNRNKRSVALDLKSKAGRDAFITLVSKADVVVENFRTGVVERLGLGYETLKAMQPRLVYCAISGYGRDGPNSDVPGYDPIAQAESGLMSLIGEADQPPVRTGPSVVDMVTGLMAAQAIASSLRHAALTGQGRLIEASLFETGVAMLLNFAGTHLMTGENPTRSGNTNQVAQPAALFEASDGPFVLAVTNDRHFRRLCAEIIRRPELAEDPRYKTNAARVKNGAELRALLDDIFRTGTRSEWVAKLRDAGVATGAVASVAEAIGSDLAAARGIVRQMEHSTLGHYPALRGVARLHDSDEVPKRGAALLGEHTREVLSEVGGLSDADIGALLAAGVAKGPG
jgi:crotonobetainyl-CoA:carnitine CoA-transferase CaiB-like acyl-CoA transferase